MKKIFIISILSILLAIPAMSQEQTGMIEGKVVTEDGSVVVNATVEISSKSLIRTLSTTTSDRGRFHFPNVRIGQYSLKVTSEQYKTFERPGLVVNIGSTVYIDVTMQPGDFEEVITITGDSPLIDVSSTDVGEVLTRDIIEKLPTPRFPTDMFAMTPGNIGGDTVTMGGGSYANAYKLDGIDVSDPQTSTVWVFVNPESIEEIEVLPIAGATADVGGFTGAAMNMVTKSGGNDFSGGIALFYFDEGYTERNTDSDTDGNDLWRNAAREIKNSDRTFFLGGPIVKDRAWFFANMGWRDRERSWGDDFEFPLTYTYKNNMVKASTLVTDSITLDGTWHYDNYLRERRGSGYNVSPEATLDQEGPNKSFAISSVWTIDNNNILEVKFHGWDGFFALMNNGEGPQIYNYDTDQVYGSSGYDYRTDRQRLQFSGKWTSYVNDFYGEHEFKVGFEWARGKAIEDDEWDYIEIWGGDFDYRENYSDSYIDSLIFINTLYVTDGWEVNDRLHLNLGVRYEAQTANSPDFTIPGGASVTGGGDIHTFHNLAPRFGFTYKLTDSGDLLLRGSIGRYYETLSTGVLDMFYPNQAVYRGYYWAGEWIEYWSSPFYSKDIYTLDNDLSQAYTDAITIGFEYDWNGIAIGVDYMQRKATNFVIAKETGRTWIPGEVETGGQTYTLYDYEGDEKKLITNGGSDLYADYRALIIRVSKRFSKKWQMSSSLTLSELEGNAASTTGGSSGQTTGGLDYFESPNNQINRTGLLGGHRPILLKVNGTYMLPYDVAFSIIGDYSSGARWSARDRQRTAGGNRIYFLMDPRGTANANEAILNVDLRIEKSFELDQFNISIFGDAYNLFNNAGITNYQSDFWKTDFNEPLRVQGARRYQIGTRISF